MIGRRRGASCNLTMNCPKRCVGWRLSRSIVYALNAPCMRCGPRTCASEDPAVCAVSGHTPAHSTTSAVFPQMPIGCRRPTPGSTSAGIFLRDAVKVCWHLVSLANRHTECRGANDWETLAQNHNQHANCAGAFVLSILISLRVDSAANRKRKALVEKALRDVTITRIERPSGITKGQRDCVSAGGVLTESGAAAVHWYRGCAIAGTLNQMMLTALRPDRL